MGPKFDPTAITIGMVWFFLMLMMCTARFDILLQVGSQLCKNIQLANRLILSCVTSQLSRYIAKYANQCQQDMQGYTFLNNTYNSHQNISFFTLSLEIPHKTQLNPWIFHKIVLDPLEIPGPKIPWKFHIIFLAIFCWLPLHCWKFHFF